MRLSLFMVLFVSALVLQPGCGGDDAKKASDVVQDNGQEDAVLDQLGQDTAEPDSLERVDNLVPDMNVPEDLASDTVEPEDNVTPDVADLLEDNAETVEEDLEQEVEPEDQLEDVEEKLQGTISVKVGEDVVAVDLSTLEQTEFDGKVAVRLTRIVEVAAIAMPHDYHYNFIANDDFNVLVDKLEGDYSKLPWWKELDFGFVYYDAEKDMLRIGWDASLGFPSSLNVKGIGGGTIEAVAIGTSNFVVIAGAVRSLLDATTLPKVDMVNYKYPEDGAIPMTTFAEIFTAAGVLDPEAYAYKFYGTDGFSNNDTNLMPFENTQHAYYEPTKRRIVLEEGWDTTECCWSVKNTVLILGVPVAPPVQ